MKRRTSDNGHYNAGDPPLPQQPLVPGPRLTLAFNGPIYRYLQFSGKTREQFESALDAGSKNAVALFGSEVVFAELQRLATAVERLIEDIERRERRDF